jgi:hypothetical protein
MKTLIDTILTIDTLIVDTTVMLTVWLLDLDRRRVVT